MATLPIQRSSALIERSMITTIDIKYPMFPSISDIKASGQVSDLILIHHNIANPEENVLPCMDNGIQGNKPEDKHSDEPVSSH